MPGRVLEGLRILDLTRVVAGPFATALLADLGADVIKVERPRTGDDYRYGPAPEGETSLSFQNTNRGKRSITLDVGHPEGRDLFLRLVDRADAVVDNFRAGWMASKGLGADVLRARNPRLVVAALSGFGATGPRAGEVSYDIVAQAAGGLLAMTGFPDGPPVRAGGALADFVGGLFLALGVVSALLARERTGGADVPCARVARPDELIDDPQLVARGMIEREPHPSLGEIVFHGNPLQFSDAAPRARRLAPALGEHNAEVYAEIGVEAAELER